MTIWYFDTPVVMWCAKHHSTAFTYTDSKGLFCVHKDCEERFWVEFKCKGVDLQAAEDAADYRTSKLDVRYVLISSDTHGP